MINNRQITSETINLLLKIARVAVLDSKIEYVHFWMTISQVFILSPRGDAIISKDFRGDIPESVHEDFFRQVRIRHELANIDSY